MTVPSTILKGTSSDNRPVLSVVTGARFVVGANGQCHRHSEPFVLQTEFEYYEGIEYPGRYKPSLLKRDTDLWPWRDNTDLVIQGVARSERPTTALDINLVVRGRTPKSASITRTIRATGDRRVVMQGGMYLSEPEPFTEMPVRYDKAYGGTDELAESRLADPEELAFLREVSGDEDEEMSEYSYPRNPAGKGYLIDPDGLDGLAWPNLEWSTDLLDVERVVAPLKKWGHRPYPAAFDWFQHGWFPRVAFFGEFPDTFDDLIPDPEKSLGILPENLGSINLFERPKGGFAQGAHPFLSRQRFVGDEQIRVSAMSPDGRDTLVQLPDLRPEILVRALSEPEIASHVSIDLILLDTERSELVMVWRGSLLAPRPHLPPDWAAQCPHRIVWR